MIALLLLTLCCGLADGPLQVRPDFSGAWAFDREKTMRLPPSEDGRLVIAAMLGDEFVANQDGRSLHLTIKAMGQTFSVVYNLDGSESRNVSPGDILVSSRASWDADRLVIVSTSTSMVDGKSLTVDTRRVIWLDRDGSLFIERTGTPASEVTPSTSIYTRVR